MIDIELMYSHANFVEARCPDSGVISEDMRRMSNELAELRTTLTDTERLLGEQSRIADEATKQADSEEAGWRECVMVARSATDRYDLVNEKLKKRVSELEDAVHLVIDPFDSPDFEPGVGNRLSLRDDGPEVQALRQALKEDE